MRPEDVPTEWVEKARKAAYAASPYQYSPESNPMGDTGMAAALAAVLPDIQAQTLAPLLAVHAEYFNTEVDAYDAAEDFSPEDTWRFDRDFREAARLTATTEEPTPPAHVGGRVNAEDCPACSPAIDPPPYPWICPGPNETEGPTT